MPFGTKQVTPPAVPGGEYFAKFDNWFSKDGIPTVVVDQTTGLPTMRLHLRIVEGEHTGENVPASFEANSANFRLILGALGVDKNALKFSLDEIATTLTLANKMLKQADKVVKVKANGSGWLSYMEGLLPDDSETLFFKFQAITSRNSKGELSWVEQDGLFGPQQKVFGTMLVVGGEFDGLSCRFSFAYPFVADGESAAWKLNKDGAFTKDGIRLKNLLKVFGIEETAFTTFADPQNVTPELAAQLTKSTKAALGNLKNGYVDLNSLKVPPAGVTIPLAGTNPDEVARKALLDVIEREVGDVVVGAEGKLNPAGVKYAKENILPVCDKLNIPRNISKMNQAEIVALLHEMGFNDDADLLELA